MKSKIKGVPHTCTKSMAYAAGGPVIKTPNDGLTSSVTRTAAGDYPSYRRETPEAGNFKSAFAAARKAGKSTFEWEGRKYTTELAQPKAAPKKAAPPPPVEDDVPDAEYDP